MYFLFHFAGEIITSLESESGAYYIGPRELTLQNAEAVIRCIQVDGPQVVQRVVEISQAGRAPDNDPALFVLALCAGLGDPAARQAALVVLPKVARTGTHLFHFLMFVEGFRGWGHWCNGLPVEQLAFQAVKYQQRDGWSHRDALRLAHPQAASQGHDQIFHWLTRGWPGVSTEPHPDPALLRNLGRLTDERRLRAARIHPVAVLAALKTYSQGRGERGKLSWTPVTEVVDALDRAFYLAFGNVEATGKRWLLGLDVSGSMAGTRVNGIPGLEARVACGALALVTAAVEPQHTFVAFDTQPYPLVVSPRQRLDDVVKLLAQTGGGGTDCAQPILWAAEQRVAVDAFVILTDSQTWAEASTRLRRCRNTAASWACRPN